MPNVQTTNLAILVSDLHFSSLPPVARQGEPDWFEAMAAPLRWLDAMAARYGVPIIAAGDIWDKPLQPPSVVNWIADNCPRMLAIPGQHDLPGHRYDMRDRSAYGTLVRCGVLQELPTAEPIKLADRFYVMGFPWGADMDKTISPREGVHVLAVAHKYIHNGQGTHYTGADESGLCTNLKFRGFAAIHCGDNHIPFEARTPDDALVINTGGFYRRAADQIAHRPSAVLLYRAGNRLHGERLYYDTSAESFSTSHLQKVESFAAAHASVDAFLESLGGDETHPNFDTVVRRYVAAHEDDLGPDVCDRILNSIEA